MNAPRRAARPGPSRRTASIARVGIATLAMAFGASLTALSAVSFRMARTVITPAGRVPNTRIVSLDTAAQTVTLDRTADTALPGRYGLFTVGTTDYLRLGSVVADDGATVTRKLLTQVAADDSIAAEAAFSGWYYDEPDQLRLPYRSVQIETPVGACPAWEFPADSVSASEGSGEEGSGEEGSGVWVIQVHGRGTTRAETLRAVPVFHALGITALAVSYRNDGEAPQSASGTYALGATEWRDVDAAIEYAAAHGARRIILMGWSMGGAMCLQTEAFSTHRDLIAGLVLESPVVDWRTVLRYQSRLLKLPRPVLGLTERILDSAWGARLVRGEAIPLDRLDRVAHADELRHPVLILHSDDDGFVPSDASHALAEARPDLVTMETFEVARHTKLWNYDETRFTRVIQDWVRRQGLASAE
ncbi:alpha/beta hydrolase [Microbacterium testaceum]|uniref:alpha/beta hydrolase family protein n=1 Tax=Microbacterium testaceum TaxID=2033 RepID=UPI000734C867|nr:alpha/beta fold hydrolase [Microbacterium testaceum]KTS61332.1 alpha/beta hydrolase [Microbacterium testaceum]